MLIERTTRRDFLRTSAIGAGAVVSAFAAEPHLTFPSKPRDRLSVTSYPFRTLIDFPGNKERDPSKPGMDLKDFAAMVATRFNVHNVNPLGGHFRSTDPAYIDEFRNSIEKAGSHLVDLGLGGRYYYDPDPAKRSDAVSYGKKWIDIAKTLGSPSARLHINGAKGAKPDVARAAETLGEVAAYGEKRNIVINLENDNPVAEGPFFLVEVIEKVKSPYLRGLPDFANSLSPAFDPELNYKAVKGMFRHVFNMVHVKPGYMDDKGELHRVDLAKLFAIAKDAGYRGYYSMEVEMPGDVYANTEMMVRETLKHIG